MTMPSDPERQHACAPLVGRDFAAFQAGIEWDVGEEWFFPVDPYHGRAEEQVLAFFFAQRPSGSFSECETALRALFLGPLGEPPLPFAFRFGALSPFVSTRLRVKLPFI